MHLHTEPPLHPRIEKEIDRRVRVAVDNLIEEYGLNWVSPKKAREILGGPKPISVRTLQTYRSEKHRTKIVFRPIGKTFEYYLPSLVAFKNRRAGLDRSDLQNHHQR